MQSEQKSEWSILQQSKILGSVKHPTKTARLYIKHLFQRNCFHKTFKKLKNRQISQESGFKKQSFIVEKTLHKYQSVLHR